MPGNPALLDPPEKYLRTLLRISVAFFACMGTAHFFGLKWPVLFVYWDTPFYAYQDKIISFTLITYIALFFGATRHRIMVPYAVLAFWGTVVGLTAVNLSAALQEVLEDQGTTGYWIVIAAFGVLATLLTVLWIRDRKLAGPAG